MADTQQLDAGLAGQEVAITGRLASMSRAEAQQRIALAGGRYRNAPTPWTTLLVVGQGGPPLGGDGRLTNSLRRARALQEQGKPLRIVTEQEFLSELGLDERHEDLRRAYTTAQLARILGVPPSQIRAWVRHGLIAPVREIRRLQFFDFRQVASAKALCELAEGGVTPRRIRRSLVQLQEWLPDAAQSLAQLQVLEQGGTLLVRTREGALAEPSGQLRLDFDADPTADRRPTRSLRLAGAAPPSWFEEGIVAEEEGRLGDAVRAYRAALEREGARPELHFNLGNALYALKDRDAAAESFRGAIDADSEYVEAWNNLGCALGDLGRVEDALHCYERALALEPSYADPHYNMALTLADAGRMDEAIPHWVTYLRSDPISAYELMARHDIADRP